MNVFVCNSERATSQGYLAHHGVEDQQWGVRNGPPYPLNRAGKLKLFKQKMKKRKEEKREKLQKKREEKEEKLKKIREKKEAKLAKKQEKIQKIQEERDKRFKEEKEKVKTSGSASDVLKYKGKWSNDDLQYISNRLKLESELSRYAASETKSATDRINEVSNAMGTMTEFANKSIGVWNTFAKIYNAKQIKRKDLRSEHLLPVVGKDSNDLIRELIKKENKNSNNDYVYGQIIKRANPYKK